jgi:hypothetical protein
MHHWRIIGRAFIAAFVLCGLPAAAQESADQPETIEQAQEPAQDLPAAESLFDRHIEAIGGKEAVFAIQSRKLTGRVKIYGPGSEKPQVTGILRIHAEAPDKIVQEIVIVGTMTQKRIFDGKAGWLLNNEDAPVAMTGEELERFTVASRFYAEADYENHFKSISTVDKQENELGSVYMVRVEHFSGRIEAYLFSEESGLLVGIVGQRANANGEPEQFQRLYENYTEYDGVKTTQLIRESTPRQLIELEFSNVENDVDLPEIERPDGISDADISGYQK